MTRQWIIKIALVLCALLQLVCSDNVGTGKAELSLTVEDVSCTEVWLHISTRNSIHSKIVLTRDTVTLEPLTLTTNEMTIVDENLLPSHRYTYTALLLGSGKSAQTIAETMDTTSHDFSFETFLLGDGTGSSCLYDVAIINDTLAYAVGEIYQDYTKDYQIYNAAKWNGKTWELMRIKVKLTYEGSQMITDQDHLKTIYSFNENDIWVVSSAGGVSHWNGMEWEMLTIPYGQGPGGANKLWGTSSNDLYAVGNNGLIAHYDGKSWSKIESGTTLDVRDIYGNGDEILAVASNYDAYRPQGRRILSINSRTLEVTVKADSGLAIGLNAIWFVSDKLYLCGGDGLFHKRDINTSTTWQMYPVGPVTNYYTGGISGNDINDIVVSGAFLEIVHFNGVSWRNYRDQIPFANGGLGRVVMKRQFLIAVGFVNRIALAVIGKR